MEPLGLPYARPMSDGELDPSTLRRPQAPSTDAPANRRILLPVALCLSLLAAPLLLVKASTARAGLRLAAHKAALRPSAPAGAGYGVPDGILTSADLAAASADGVTAAGAAAVIPADAAQAGPDSFAGVPAAAAQAHIASVSPASPVTSSSASSTPSSDPPTTSPPSTSPAATSPPTTSPPTTSPPTTQPPASTTTTRPSSSNSETGSASWYQAPAGTCAHPSLPFGTVVTVENLANGATTTCRVEDRGPYQGGRIIDLSEATFSQIASTSDGVIQVRISW